MTQGTASTTSGFNILSKLNGSWRKVIENLENQYLQAQNLKLWLLPSNLLINGKQDPCNIMHTIGVDDDGVAFINIKCTVNAEEDDE
jgi:hypothetical protein